LSLIKKSKKKKQLETKLKSGEESTHKVIEQELTQHAKKCACEHASSAAEKEKCQAACKSRQEILKKTVLEHVDETASSCAVKASLACTNEKDKTSCKQCKKSFIVLCVEEQTKRKQELLNLLDNCDSFLEEDYGNVYQS